MNRSFLLMVSVGVVSILPEAQAGSSARKHRSAIAKKGQSMQATMSVQNLRPEAVRVYVDGRFTGMVETKRSLRQSIKAGKRRIEMRALDGTLLSQSDRVFLPHQQATLAVGVAPAQIGLRNDSGVALRVYDGQQVVASLEPGQRQRVDLEPGRHFLQAIYVQHGQPQTLVTDLVELAEGEFMPMPFAPPAETLVVITNDLGRAAQLTINGEPGPWIAAGDQSMVSVPVGLVSLQLLRYGRIAGSSRVLAQPSVDAAWVATSDRWIHSTTTARRSSADPAPSAAAAWWAEAAPTLSFWTLARVPDRERYDDDDDRDDDDSDDDRRECVSC